VAYMGMAYYPSCSVSEVVIAEPGMVCLRDYLAIDFEAHIVAVGFVEVEVEVKAGHSVLKDAGYLAVALDLFLHQRL
jgi:hypothetical protein